MYLVIPLVKFFLAAFKLIDIIMKIIERKYIYILILSLVQAMPQGGGSLLSEPHPKGVYNSPKYNL